MGEGEHVVAVEVGRVVEGARGRVGPAEPQGCRVTADRAEAVRREPRQVECAEAAHRDSADRDPVRVGARAGHRRRDRLA